jgi:hypothetical protein
MVAKYHSADWLFKSPKRVTMAYDYRPVVPQLYDLGCVHSKNEFKELAAHLVIVVHHLTDMPVTLGGVNAEPGAIIPASVVDQTERPILLKPTAGNAVVGQRASTSG